MSENREGRGALVGLVAGLVLVGVSLARPGAAEGPVEPSRRCGSGVSSAGRQRFQNIAIASQLTEKRMPPVEVHDGDC